MRANPLPRALVATIAVAAIAASPAWAGFPIPNPSYSTVPARLILLRSPSIETTYSVVIRDLAQFPVANSSVALEFSGCAGTQLCTSQPDPDVVTSQWCSYRVMAKVTDASGRADFRLVGSAAGLPGGACAADGCGNVYADGIFMGHFTVRTPDLDGVGGVNPSDLSLWLELFFSGAPCLLADFDDSGELGPSDLSRWLEYYFSGPTQACAAAPCP